jgi:hypothetical protein
VWPQEKCGKENFNATGFASQAAMYLGSAYVIGANAKGKRPYWVDSLIMQRVICMLERSFYHESKG